ncbi:MAG: hypothetical protein IPK16_17440 [Anaerolineales bacterium]|nr:hypothetical protein [Anaerolineales bacterium]
MASIQMVAEVAKRKGQQLWTSVDPPGLGQVNDRRRVQQILINLLNNAVKFTPEGGEIELKAWIDRESQMVVYSIQDTGIGIAADDIPRIFQPFVQLDTGLTRNYGGTGLGLVLARRMAELCGGQIGVESAIGQGSRFYVTVPQLTLASD